MKDDSPAIFAVYPDLSPLYILGSILPGIPRDPHNVERKRESEGTWSSIAVLSHSHINNTCKTARGG